ncbi:hypothetical protein [Citricoccus sp. GCM10030269]|uniref:hypothetical protein n=1 Tax=Citricoccus sp. GCM10030269 TaxID=3273388 RepID=UPI003607E0A1
MRGWAAALIATLLAAGSHTVAASSGHHDAGPAPVVWILTLALAGLLCTALAGRALSWWRLGLAVGASQLLFHWLYSMAAVPLPATGLTDPHAAAGHGAAAHASVTDAVATHGAVTHAAATHPASADHLSMAMVCAHVLAAVGTVVLLRRGEVLAARVAELAVGVVLRSPGARMACRTLLSPVRRVPVRASAPAWGLSDVVLSCLRLRGPPSWTPSVLTGL